MLSASSRKNMWGLSGFVSSEILPYMWSIISSKVAIFEKLAMLGPQQTEVCAPGLSPSLSSTLPARSSQRHVLASTSSTFRLLFGAGVLAGLYTPGKYTDQGDCSVNYFGWNCKDSGSFRFHESGGSLLHGHQALFRWEPVRKIVIIILSNDGGVQHAGSLIRVGLLNELREAVIKGRL